MPAQKPKRLNDRNSRMMARRERDSQWAFMERVAREGVVWMCPWDKYRRHGLRCANSWCDSRSCTHEPKTDDGVYVFGLLGSNEFFHWLGSHKDWWKHGRWSEKRCARSIRITEEGRIALQNRHLYDSEDISGGMVEPGYIVRPLPIKAVTARRPSSPQESA